MKLNQIVPWGRSFAEYQAMFNLTPADLLGRILGCGDGPASFNATATRQGSSVISCDPLYQFTQPEIRRRVDEVYPEIMAKMEQGQEDFVWDRVGNVKELGQVRMVAMSQFLSDFPAGYQEGRYINASLPDLPFEDPSFDLALCSHYLFLYSDHLDGDGHLRGLRELCRVAREVRIFPVVSLNGTRSEHLDRVQTALKNEGIHTSLEPVSYRFQKGATEMLVARRDE